MKLSKLRMKIPRPSFHRLKSKLTPKKEFSNISDKEQITLKESLRSPEIRKKLMVTFGLILVYRLLAAVPLPGIYTVLFA